MKTLLVVITRLTRGIGDNADEFQVDWNTPKDDSPAKLFSFLSLDAHLLLVHGHKQLDRQNLGRTILDVAQHEGLSIADIDWPQVDIVILMHGIESDTRIGSPEARQKSIGQLFGQSPRIYAYSSYGSESVFKGFNDKFDEAFKDADTELKRKLWTELLSNCLNSAKAQENLLLEIRELLPSFTFNLYTALKAKDASRQRALAALDEIQKQIRAHLQLSLLQKLENRSLEAGENHKRLYLIWGEPHSNLSFDDSWHFEGFWRLCKDSENLAKDLDDELNEHFNLKAVSDDLRALSEGLTTLIEALAREHPL